jgi:hypothetical protein
MIEVEEEEEEWQKKLRNTIMEAAGLTPEQAKICMQHIRKTFKEKVGEEAKKAARRVIRDEQELNKCRRSILMHNADKWVAGDTHTAGYSLAERVTSAIHRIAGGMVMVMECFAIGAWQAGRMPTSVYLTFGSQQQKTAFFRIMANRIRFGDERARLMRVVACRDAFPKEYISEAKELANKGMSLKRDGQVVSFRVVARGAGCIPVLETREWLASGQPAARWAVHRDAAQTAAETAAAAPKEKAAGEQQQEREEEWQTVTNRRNQKTAGKAKQATPAKVTSTGSRLSVAAKPTLSPKGGEDMDSEDIVRFPEGYDEQHYQEPY